MTMSPLHATPLPLLWALTGCADPPPQPSEPLRFVRDGVVAPAGETGNPLPDGTHFVPRTWSPGEQVTVHGQTATAPHRAECVPLFSVPLGDVSRLVSAGGGAPNTAMAFSPGGDLLAVGSHRGEVLVVDGWSGEILARKRLAETMVKAVAWSHDGQTLYAAEQSPDAFLHALRVEDLNTRWSLRLADVVGSSAPPPDEDIYGVYKLPAAYGLLVLPSDDVVVTALHSWADETGQHRNQSQLLRIRPDGQIASRWPAEPVEATLKHPRLDDRGELLLVSVNHSSSLPPPPDLPVGGVVALRLDDLTPITEATPSPLQPWFSESFVWEALDISAEHGIFIGLGDGRVLTYDLSGAPSLEASTGAPIMAGDVPIHASVGFGGFHEGGLLYTTSTTLIPYGASSSALRPPSAHPAENTLWYARPDNTVVWSWTGSQILSGLTHSPDGRFLVVGAGDRDADTRRDLYGALIFDLQDPMNSRSGEQRLQTFCPTQGPVFFRQAASVDGRIALAEYPYQDEDGSIEGSYQVTVMR